MASYYIIAAGGTGAMCARAFIYMAAAGCAEQNATYHILLMDKDKESDAMTSCENLLKEYEAMRCQLGLKPDNEGAFSFPVIKLHRWDFTEEIVDEYRKRTGRPASDLASLTLKKLLNPDEDPLTDRLLATVYSKDELNTDLNKGFYGHPNIGAPVFDYISDRFIAQRVVTADGVNVENTFMKELHATLKTDKAFVYLFGSLFGGTGATVLPNVALTLRSMRDPNNKTDHYGQTRLVLGGSVIMPYFRLPACPPDSVEILGKVKPVDSKFAGQTQEALSYYHESNLLSKMMNLLLLGSAKLDVTSELFARGGSQNQHFHLVLLVAAVAANRFFAGKLGNMANGLKDKDVETLGELLVWKISAQDDKNRTLTPEELDLKEEFEKLRAFLRFSVVVAYFMRLQFKKSDDELKKYSVEVMATAKQMVRNDRHLDPKNLSNDDIDKCYRQPVENASAICRGFIRFMLDVSLSGYDWSKFRNLEKSNDPPQYEGSKAYYTFVPGVEDPNATTYFTERWTDFSNLTALKQILDADKLIDVIDNLTLNEICSHQMLDDDRAPYEESRFPNNIATVYHDTLHDLEIYKTILGKIKNDKRWFCEIYDLLMQKCK